MNRSTELNNIEIREGWKGYYLFAFILWIGIITAFFIIPDKRQDTINFFFHNLTITKALIFAVILGVPGLCLFYYFDRRVKLKIDKYGVWTRKEKCIAWTDISDFRSREIFAGEEDTYLLIFTLKNSVNQAKNKIEIRLRRVDKDFNEIRKMVFYYLEKYNISDSGHKKIWF